MRTKPAQATAVGRGSSDLRLNFEKGRKKGEKKKKASSQIPELAHQLQREQDATKYQWASSGLSIFGRQKFSLFFFLRKICPFTEVDF
jgi:hypothetical protein